MTELLLFYVCSGGLPGCSESQQTYMHYNPAIQEFLDIGVQKLENVVPRFIAKDAAPIIALVTKKEVTIPMNKYASVILQEQNTLLQVSYGF